LSEGNMILAGCLLVFVFVFGPTIDILNSLVQSTGAYVSSLIDQAFRMGAGDPEQEGKWILNWTVFYWGWWLSWAPFVGMFVARISRGRTIREFLLAVLLVPTSVSILWFSVFGGTALSMEAAGVPLSELVQANPAVAVYAMLEELPWSQVSSFLTALAVIIFFVSSSDSASFVVDMLTSGGNPDPPIWQRIFWATAEGATAGVLLYAGGAEVLRALQAGVISLALPFCVLILLLCYSLAKGLRGDPRYGGAVNVPEDSDHSGEGGGSGPGLSASETPA
jgi:choline/glycine/proline betaine transport protein